LFPDEVNFEKGGFKLKKIIWIAGLLLASAVCLIILFYNPDKLDPESRAGKNVYFTIIESSGEQLANGRFEYTQDAFNTRGKKKEMTFTSGKELEKGNYVKLYYTWLRGVTYYEVIAPEEVQGKAALQFKKQ
jgi:uncharacterized protein (TIGR01655 family)